MLILKCLLREYFEYNDVMTGKLRLRTKNSKKSMEVCMNIHDEWLESFNRPRDRGISFFKKYYSYQLLDKTIYPKGVKLIYYINTHY